jgi:hypothetical protein
VKRSLVVGSPLTNDSSAENYRVGEYQLTYTSQVKLHKYSTMAIAPVDLLQVLQAAVLQDPASVATRKAAEAQLKTWETHHGFYSLLQVCLVFHLLQYTTYYLRETNWTLRTHFWTRHWQQIFGGSALSTSRTVSTSTGASPHQSEFGNSLHAFQQCAKLL